MKNIIKEHFKSDFFIISVFTSIIVGGSGVGALSIYFVCKEFCKTYQPSGFQFEFHPIKYDIYTNWGSTLLLMGIGSLLVFVFMVLLNLKAIRDLNKIKG